MIQPGTLQRWRIGEALKADKLNQPVDKLNRMAGVGPARQHMPRPIPEGGESETVARLVAVTAVEGEMLLTRTVKRHIVEELPWDGRWEFAGEETPMRPWPLVDVAEYESFVTGLDADGLVEEDGRIFDARKRGTLWFVARPSGGGSGVVEKFRVEHSLGANDPNPPMQDDFFYATRLSTDEERIRVAKPYELRVTPWNNQTVFIDALGTDVTYSYDLFTAPVDFNERLAVREDQPQVRETQIIWPLYHTRARPGTPDSIIKAVQIGEEVTGIDGVEWEDTNDAGRVWTLLPASFQ